MEDQGSICKPCAILAGGGTTTWPEQVWLTNKTLEGKQPSRFASAINSPLTACKARKSRVSILDVKAMVNICTASSTYNGWTEYLVRKEIFWGRKAASFTYICQYSSCLSRGPYTHFHTYDLLLKLRLRPGWSLVALSKGHYCKEEKL